MDELHGVIVSLKAYSGSGHDLLKKLVREVAELMEIISLSSVYRVQGKIISSGGIHDLRSLESFSGLAVAIKGATPLDPHELLDRFAQIEFEMRSEVLHRSVSVNLMTYEGRTIMTPGLTLPHPQLHTNPENLIPASEVWGDFLHPVLNQTLLALSKQRSKEAWGEFYAQGKTLLDF